MDFRKLVEEAPIRTELADFQGLFEVEIIVTSRDEVQSEIKAASSEVYDSSLGQSIDKLDNDKLRKYLITRVKSFKGLTVTMGLALCGRTLPKDMKKKGKDPLIAAPETIKTLFIKVNGLEIWLLNKLKVIGADAARREAQAQEN